MVSKRYTKRQRVLKAGTISFQGSGIDCVVRNMSIGGANLEVESHNGIPDSFDLLTGAEVNIIVMLFGQGKADRRRVSIKVSVRGRFIQQGGTPRAAAILRDRKHHNS